MKAKLLLSGVVGLAVAGLAGCSGGSGKSITDSFSSVTSAMGMGGATPQPAVAASATTPPTTQPGDVHTVVSGLITQLQTDINAKNWAGATSDAAKLAPYHNQLTPDQQQLLITDQAKIAAGQAGSKFGLGSLIPGSTP